MNPIWDDILNRAITRHYMPKVTIKGKVKHLPYTKAGMKKAKALASKMPSTMKKGTNKGKSKKK